MLDYLFEVQYKDGTRLEQNPEDTSTTREGGSAFSDVVIENVARFHLVSQNLDHDVWTVDLVKGQFQHNFRPFEVEVDPYPNVVEGRKLIFWRVKNLNFHVGSEGIDQEPYESVYVAYIIGWEEKGRDGKNVQKTIKILI